MPSTRQDCSRGTGCPALPGPEGVAGGTWDFEYSRLQGAEGRAEKSVTSFPSHSSCTNSAPRFKASPSLTPHPARSDSMHVPVTPSPVMTVYESTLGPPWQQEPCVTPSRQLQSLAMTQHTEGVKTHGRKEKRKTQVFRIRYNEDSSRYKLKNDSGRNVSKVPKARHRRGFKGWLLSLV